MRIIREGICIVAYGKIKLAVHQIQLEISRSHEVRSATGAATVASIMNSRLAMFVYNLREEPAFACCSTYMHFQI